MNTQNGSSNSQAFAFSAGLQADITFGKNNAVSFCKWRIFYLNKGGLYTNTQVMVNGSARNVVLFRLHPR